jgi:hypothetical protein
LRETEVATVTAKAKVTAEAKLRETEVATVTAKLTARVMVRL